MKPQNKVIFTGKVENISLEKASDHNEGISYGISVYFRGPFGYQLLPIALPQHVMQIFFEHFKFSEIYKITADFSINKQLHYIEFDNSEIEETDQEGATMAYVTGKITNFEQVSGLGTLTADGDFQLSFAIKDNQELCDQARLYKTMKKQVLLLGTLDNNLERERLKLVVSQIKI